MRTLTIACAALAALLVLESPALAQDGGAPREPVQAEDAPRVRSDGGVPVRRVRPRPAPAAPEAATPDSPEPASPAAPEPAIEPGQGVSPESPAAPPDQVPPSYVLDGGVPSLDVPAPEDGAPDGFTTDALDGGIWAGDAGVPDAGTPDVADAGVDAGAAQMGEEPTAPPAAEPAPDGIRSVIDGFTNALRELTLQRESTPSEPQGTAGTTPVEPRPSGQNEALNNLLREWLGIEPPPSLGLLLLLLFTLAALWVIERARRPLPDRGLFPRALGVARIVLRFAVVLIALMLASRLLPAWLHPAVLLALAASAIALGFGVVWLPLPDLFGGLVLLTEGRLKRGQWVSGEGFAGTVEELGARVTLLRADDGALLSVPNRVLVKSPLRVSDRPWHEVDVELRAPAGIRAQRLRDAIRDAVVCSPYVPPDPGLVVVRDSRDPDLWRLKVRLVDIRFSAAFEGQLLERVEEALAEDVDQASANPTT